MTLNERAADWLCERFGVPEQKALLKTALLKHLPDDDWAAYNDYDPQGLLLVAVREFRECAGFMFSGAGLFPEKTGIYRRVGKLYTKEGYGANYIELK